MPRRRHPVVQSGPGRSCRAARGGIGGSRSRDPTAARDRRPGRRPARPPGGAATARSERRWIGVGADPASSGAASRTGAAGRDQPCHPRTGHDIHGSDATRGRGRRPPARRDHGQPDAGDAPRPGGPCIRWLCSPSTPRSASSGAGPSGIGSDAGSWVAWGWRSDDAHGAGSTTRSSRSRGHEVRTRPVGSVQTARASGKQANAPAGSLLDAVVASAEAHEVGGLRRARGPRPYVVEVAEPGGDRAPREAAAPVPHPDESLEPPAGSVGDRGTRPDVEQRTRHHVALRHPGPHADPGAPGRRGPSGRSSARRRPVPDEAGDPLPAHEHRVTGERACDLDEVATEVATDRIVRERGLRRPH